MITVRVEEDGKELALIRVNHLWRNSYYAEFAFNKSTGLALVRRTFLHDSENHNVITLVKEALAALDPHHLEFKGGPVSPSDLARRLGGVGATLQGWARQLRNH